jgi:predicted SAM-dependent methyltransferase
MKLHIGCGYQHKDGWINIDIEKFSSVDIVHDARTIFPYSDNSIDFVFNEHFIEHISLQDGISFLKEMYRIIKPNGVIRIAAPDLDVIIDQFVNDSWRDDFKKAQIPCNTRCEMLDMSMRGWGHLYLYNYEELEYRLKNSGFINISRKELYKSDYPELCNLETRWASFLIIEATK